MEQHRATYREIRSVLVPRGRTGGPRFLDQQVIEEETNLPRAHEPARDFTKSRREDQFAQLLNARPHKLICKEPAVSVG